MKKRVLGEFIVADPAICHGKPTFKGTRIMVSQVLEQIARGMSWNDIIREWRGRITKNALREATRLAHRAFLDHAEEYTKKSVAV